jgi:hypothetical protein
MPRAPAILAVLLIVAIGLAVAPAGPEEAELMAAGRRVMAAHPAKASAVLPGIGYTCLAATALADTGDQGAQATAKAAADVVMRKLIGGPASPRGWGYEGTENCAGPGSSDAFGDGTCNAGDTAYAFQTGLAATCLARATVATGDPAYARIAKAVLIRWGRAADRPCPACVQFQPSDSANDRGRAIRNTNALMGMAAAWTFTATGDAEMRRLARGVAATEAREAAAGNVGYLSVADRDFKANPSRQGRRLENHYPFIAKGLLDIGALTRDPRSRALGRRAMADWMACRGADCSRLPCTTWAAGPACAATAQALTPCFFRDDPDMAVACERVLAQKPRFSSYHVWVVADGRSPRFARRRR